MGEKKKKLSLEEERQNLQDAMKSAIARNNMAEYHRLNKHLQWLEQKIRRKK